MNEIAVPHARVKPRLLLAPLAAVLALAAALLLGPVGSAGAAPLVGKDGKLRACYKVKGKPKGAVRMIRGAKTRCRRGERKVAWYVTGPATSAQQGPSGAPGAPGKDGQVGGDGAAGEDASALAAQVGALTLKVESLESVLDGVSNDDLRGVVDKLAGVTNADLLGVVGKLSGITNADLLKAVGAVPVLESVCGQVSGLVTQSNLLGEGLGETVDALLGSVLAVLFGEVDVPEAIDPFACAGI